MSHFLENKWAISITAGLLLALSFPPVNLSFLSIPAFMLFIHLANTCDSNKQLAFYSYAGFLVWNLATTYWLMMASVVAGLAANLANAVLMTIPLVLMRFFQKKYQSTLFIVLLQACAWTTYEFLHHNWDLAWPWIAVGNAWAKQVSLIQFISITGHLGITFWVVFTAAISYQAFTSAKKKHAYYAISSLLILPLASLVYFAIDTPVSPNEYSISVTIVQPNHDSYEPYGGMSGNTEVVDSLFSITEKYHTESTDLVVWPENAIERAVLMESVHVNRVADSSRSWNTAFIVGSGLITLYPENPPELTRGLYGNIPYNVYNGAFFTDKLGTKSRYDKNNLVPIVERVPFLKFLSAIDVFDLIDWGRIAGFGKGYTPDMLETAEFMTPGLICYDSVYPSWIREFVNNGAGFLTIITNDGWWGDSSGHRQHFEYAKLRAIEFNRWIVRSANNGTSGIIRPDGTVEQKTDYWVRTAFNSNIPVIKEQTFYARYGDWLSYQCLGITLVFWILAILNPQSISTLMK
ncbi:MAG: apolipoprotein N-acyltransferase [Balneolaceae bacterium]